ncbi:hypothetical protein [Nocardia sp. NBC_01329]|nr:hypothetical protein OG405_08485 [Nocardia sp. NBC_01329]
MAVQDLFLHNEITVDGPWPSITVYYSEESVGKLEYRASVVLD